MNCTDKPSNAVYSQTGTCDWTCEYGLVREGNMCVQAYNYAWYTGTWSTCNADCGSGTQTRIVECRNTVGVTVNNWHCSGTMPPASQSCNTQACTNYSWSTGNWGTCYNGQQTRSVICQNSSGQNVADYYCNSTKPTTTQSCMNTIYTWKIGNWGTCVNSIRDRTILCERDD